MNKKSLLTIVALAAVFAGAGCNKSGKLNTPSQFTTPTGPVELKVKWSPGERVLQEMDMKQTSEINVPGQPAPIKQNVVMGQKYALTVLNQDAAGGRELEFEFLSSRMSVETGGKTVLAYDSAKPAPPGKKNDVADVLSKVVGSKLRFFMDTSNNVERIEGLDELVNRLSTTRQDATATGLKSTFNEGYFKQVMSGNRLLPSKPVQPGDTWTMQMEFPLTGLGTMTLDYNITFKSWELHGKRNCARLEYDGGIKLKPDATPAPGGMKVSIPDGSMSGVSWFDPELGIVIDSVMNEDMTQVITLPGNARAGAGAAGQGMILTNQMSETLNIKLDSVK